jgi:hypothetical protein
MLALSLVQEIDRLLSEGQLSRRKIAQRLRVSRSVVCAIANGQRGLYGKQPEPDEPDREALPPERCPKCGYLVQMPCLVCRTREYRHGRRVLAALSAQRGPAAHHSRRPPVRQRNTYRARVA